MQSISRIRDIRKEANREENIYYSHFSGHYQGNGSHGGEDVSVYAIGIKKRQCEEIFFYKTNVYKKLCKCLRSSGTFTGGGVRTKLCWNRH